MNITTYKLGIDIQNITPPLHLKNYKLIAFDMDSTLIDMETVDEIAAAVGKKAEVAAITEAAMCGEIADYKESLRRRIALLKGVPMSALEQVRDQRMRLNPGAETLVKTAQKNGLKTMLVSGGFTLYTDALKQRLGLDFARSNVLDIHEGKLTGHLVDQEWGDICDGEEKKKTLLAMCEHYGISPHQTIAMGDGANDLPMMRVAGLAIAYHAKPVVRQEAHIAINEGGLDRVLEVVLPS
ncbi:MAG: phosphoserine phosphatase SerB [Saezia sp.]